MKTARERNDERRKEKLREMQEAIAAGSLIIRQMTPQERAKFPPRRRAGKRRLQGRAFR